MKGAAPESGTVRILTCALILAAGFLFLAGCIATSPSGGAVPATTPGLSPTLATTATTPTLTSLQSKIVQVPGNDKGTVILVGRSTCPWCQKTKALLGNMSVGYYWIDLNNLDQAETAQVMSALTICSDTSAVPILVINGQKCIVGYEEDQIRQALG
jgi:glutaredoxin